MVDHLTQKFPGGPLNSRRFPGFPGGFLNSHRFPGVIDTLYMKMTKSQLFVEVPEINQVAKRHNFPTSANRQICGSSRLAWFKSRWPPGAHAIHQMKWVNSCNGSAMTTAPHTLPLILLLLLLLLQ